MRHLKLGVMLLQGRRRLPEAPRYFLQAKHDTAVYHIDLTPDGLQVVCALKDGSLGVLDMKSHGYETVLSDTTKF